MACTRPSRTKSHLLAGGIAIGALIASALAMPVASASGGYVADPASYVNTLAGTGSGGSTVGSINNFPGPSTPFGMVQFSPDNASSSNGGSNGAGYYYDNDKLRGFSLNHASQGCGAFGDFPVLPTTISMAQTDSPWSKPNALTHTGEVAEPGYYKLTSTDNANSTIVSELTATTRTGVAQFTFPSGTTPKLTFRSGISNGSTTKGSMTINPNTGVITGWTENGSFCGQQNTYRTYFAAKAEQPFTTYGTWDESAGTVNAKTVTGSGDTDSEAANISKPGGYIGFAQGTTTVRLKIALSYVSTDNAVLNMNTEVPTVNAAAFSSVRSQTYATWNSALSKVEISDTSSTAERKTFYHSLYRTLLHPNVFDDVNGQYIGFETNPTVHNVSEAPASGGRTRHQYANFSDWDTYRTQAPLMATLFPEVASDVAQSYVNDAKQSGQLPRWALANASTDQMSGDNASAQITQIYAYGATDFDTTTALHYMNEGAVGETAGTYTGGTNSAYILRPGAKDYTARKYAPQTKPFQSDHAVTGASITQEYSIDDFAISRFASAIGNTATAAVFSERSNYWQNLFNPTTGFVSPRDYNGKFPQGADGNITPSDFGYRGHITGFGQVGFDEGNAEQYLWLEPQNVAGLTNALGGREATAVRLDKFMTGGYNVGDKKPNMWIGNEPDFNVPWLYNYVGRPWRTQEVVDEIRTTLFGSNPNGAEPGNDDLGAQSSWYVWAALGIYPATPGTDVLTVNTPAFDKALIHLGNGKTLTINAAGANTKRYISGLKVNGESQTKTYLPSTTLTTDTTLDFTLASTADTSWGTAESDAPPSYSDGSVALVSNVDPIANATPGVVTVAPGGSSEADLDLQRITSTSSRYTVAVTSPDPGLTVSLPGQSTFDSSGHGKHRLTISASNSVGSGFYDIDVVTTTSAGETSTATVTVKVARPGSITEAQTVVGSSPEDAATGSFDGMGNTFSSDQLGDKGLTPGAVKQLSNGTTLTWPSSPVTMVNTIIPSGQRITLDRPATKISFVGAGINTGGAGTATVTLDNGQQQTADFSFGDWVKPSTTANTSNPTVDGPWAPSNGNSIVAWTSVRNATSNDPGAYIFATTPYTAPAGRKIVSVTLPTTNKARIFTIAQSGTPTITASPSSVVAGSTVTVTGSGFVANESVTVKIGTTSATATTGTDGTLHATVTVPLTAAVGQTQVTVTSATVLAGVTASITVTAPTWTPTISAPAEALVKSAVAFTGTGFAAGEQVAVKLGTTAVTVTADGTGRISGSVTAPAVPGTSALTATGDVSRHSVSTSVRVKALPTPPAKVTTAWVKVSGKKYTRGKSAKATVQISKLSNGAYPTGSVQVYVGKKKAVTVKISAAKKGKVTVTVPKSYTKAKSIKVKATYVPTDTRTVVGQTSKTLTMKSKKK